MALIHFDDKNGLQFEAYIFLTQNVTEKVSN